MIGILTEPFQLLVPDVSFFKKYSCIDRLAADSDDVGLAEDSGLQLPSSNLLDAQGVL